MKRNDYPWSVGKIIQELGACSDMRMMYSRSWATPQQLWDKAAYGEMRWFIYKLYHHCNNMDWSNMDKTTQRYKNQLDALLTRFDDVFDNASTPSTDHMRGSAAMKMRWQEEQVGNQIRAQIKFPQKAFEFVLNYLRRKPQRRQSALSSR